MGNSQKFRCIMPIIMSTIGDGIEKVANDVTTAVESALPVLAQFTFEYALHAAFAALLS